MHGLYWRSTHHHGFIRRLAWRDWYTDITEYYYRYDNGRLISSWSYSWRRGGRHHYNYGLRRIGDFDAFNYLDPKGSKAF